MQKILNISKTRSNSHTHVTMGNRRGKYQFSRQNLYEFFHKYDPVKDNLCLAEKPQQYSPVLVDIDIKRNKDTINNVSRSHKHILDVVKTYQKVLKNIVPNLTNKDLTCVFLDKPIYETSQNKSIYVKNGFHLHFPYIFLDKNCQKVHLIPRVRDEINRLQTFQDLGYEDSGKLVDDVTDNCWLVYGAVKEEGMLPYEISKVFDHELNEISLEKGLCTYPLLDKQENKIKLETKVDIIKNLPQILSIIPIVRHHSICKESRTDLENPQKVEHKEERSNKSDKKYKDKNTDQLLNEAKQLCKIISPQRSDDRIDWLKIGWILYNISQGDDDGFQIWNEFSAQCGEKYYESVCEYTWNKMKEGDLTIGTLHYFAKIDNPKAYKQFIRENNDDIIKESLQGGHYDCAELFEKVYGKNYVKITSQKDLSCFIWDDQRKLWVEEGVERLKKVISDVLCPIYVKIGQELFKKLSKTSDNAEIAMINAKIKQVQKMIGNFKSAPFINNITKALAGHIIDKEFETKVINRSKHELPIKDGKIINLKTLDIRDRIFTDYWSFECNASFLGEKSDLSCVEKFFNDICCDSKDLVDYHRRLWGYLLTGEISDRSLHIFWGNGCNGKSSIVNIFSNIVGDFSTSLSEDVMLKKTSRGANPELMPLLTARLGVLPESDKKEELNSKRVKTITGDDNITARHLFGHLVSFKTQCKPIWATNFKPKINVDDQAILDRLKLIPFLGRFEKNQQNTAYINDLQENHLDEFFTWFCSGAYDWYGGEELIPCKEMTNEMNKYISENDVTAEFLEDTYQTITEEDYTKLSKLDKKEWLTVKTILYPDFCCWIQDNNRKDDMLGKKEFYKQIEDNNVLLKKSNGKWFYLCKKIEDDEISSEDENYNGLQPM
jgi:P4 family phage/plasmid primase-like protien